MDLSVIAGASVVVIFVAVHLPEILRSIAGLTAHFIRFNESLRGVFHYRRMTNELLQARQLSSWLMVNRQ